VEVPRGLIGQDSGPTPMVVGTGDNWRPVSGGVPFRFCSFARSAIWYAVFRKMQPLFADGFLHWLIDPSLFVKVPRAAIISFLSQRRPSAGSVHHLLWYQEPT
jgi:hypothetical protein